MEVVERSATRLVLRRRPWLEWTVGALMVGAGAFVLAAASEGPLFGGAFVAIGALVLLLGARVVTITFDRGAGQCTREERGVLRRTALRTALGDIVRVQVETRSTSRGHQAAWVVLVLSNRRHVDVARVAEPEHAARDGLAALVAGFLGLDAPTYERPPGFGEAMAILAGKSPPPAAGAANEPAIAECEALLRRDPDDADAYVRLATALAQAGRPAEAQAVLERGRARFAGSGSPALAARLESARRRLQLAGPRG